ncbi:MAG TPA: RyR domain-containing protein [Lachnospiraceae bacterium]|nr:RyR domain-containing protein [Lachnospiraceae bacterium]
MNTKKQKTGKFILYLLPFIIGMYGIWIIDHARFTDAVYDTLHMYALSFGGEPDNIFIEIARWTAPLVTASWIITCFSILRNWWHNRIVYLMGNSIAVYYGAEERTNILSKLEKKGISGENKFLPAKSYILLGSENENYAFVEKNKDRLSGHNIYLKSSMARTQTLGTARIKTFSPEENAARIFWKKNRAGERQKIILTDFGKLGEELLYWGLQDNIYSPDQMIEYHIFGSGEKYTATHPYLSEISDRIEFHPEPWYKALALFDSADRILVCGEQTRETVRELLFAVPGKTLDVFDKAYSGSDFFEAKGRLRYFDWKKESMTPAIILDELLLARAKSINLRYAVLYSGAKNTDEEKERQWEKLDAFTRYSNISAADYHEIRLQMLKEQGISDDPQKMQPEVLEKLAELEHIRWCRYHYLNNWHYGIPENGKAKDREKRIHSDLVPYKDLTGEEKEKDRENVRILFSAGS